MLEFTDNRHPVFQDNFQTLFMTNVKSSQRKLKLS